MKMGRGILAVRRSLLPIYVVALLLGTSMSSGALPVYLAAPDCAGCGPDKVIEYDSITGRTLREFVYQVAPATWTPTGVAIGPSGNLFVASQSGAQTDLAEILEIDLGTGDISVFATEGINGIFGLTFGPNGNLFASSACGSAPCPKVVQYNGTTGALIGTFVAGVLPGGAGIAFGPSGSLFIGGNGEVVEYDGTTGALIGTFASGHGLAGPHGLTFAPGGNLIVADTSGGLLEFDGVSGVLSGLLIRKVALSA